MITNRQRHGQTDFTNFYKTCVERCNVRLSAVRGTQQWLPISQRMTVETDVLLSLSETAAVSWRFLSLVANCSKLELPPPETSGRRGKNVVTRVDGTSSVVVFVERRRRALLRAFICLPRKPISQLRFDYDTTMPRRIRLRRKL